MNQDKQLYWKTESNGDLSVSASSIDQACEVIKADFEDLSDDEKTEVEYVIKPVWYSDEEINKLEP